MSPHLDVDISCCQCNAPYQIERVRQIEPLRLLSDTIEEKLRRKSPKPESKKPSTRTSSTGSVDTGPNYNNKDSFRKGQLTEFFDQCTERPSKLQTVKSYCFSADSQSLLLWIRCGAKIVFYDISSGGIEKFPAKGVSFAAAGAKFYAVLSSDGNVVHL